MSKPATGHTRRLHEEATRLEDLTLRWEQDLADVTRGLMAELPNGGVVTDDQGRPVFSSGDWAFARPGQAPPDTVHPSLWRQMQLIQRAGLFAVTERIYQVRGADAANLTIIEGDTGVIVVDPLTCVETAKFAFDLYCEHRGRRPVHAVISTHSHVDHFGGIGAIVPPEMVATGAVQVIVPEHFVEEYLSENVLAGNVMARRASYMFGYLLPPGPTGAVGVGLCQTIPLGTGSYIAPNREITVPGGEEVVIDGLTFVFQLAPNTEAPAEMHFLVRELRAMTAAENANHTMHNVQTLRGAKPRDAANWARALGEAVELFVDDVDVLFFMHTWPVWGNENVRDFLTSQHDMYKYLHDQSLHLANQGFVPTEIAERIEFPDAIGERWFNRGYYGSVSHNSKAVYDKYLGWFDGNAVNLNRYSPTEAGRRFVETLGGADAVVAKAQEYFDRGDYRWTTELLDHVVFAEPHHDGARALQSDAYEQLGYQAENGTWRNFYLSAAAELRGELRTLPASNVGLQTLLAMPFEALLDFYAVRLAGPAAAERDVAINLHVTGEGNVVLRLRAGVLSCAAGGQDTAADASLAVDKATLLRLGFSGPGGVAHMIGEGALTVDGDPGAVEHLMANLVRFERTFAIAMP